MCYFNSLADLIGNTPLVRLNHVGVPEGARLFAKLELMNPLGSVKDRTGKYMVEAAERDGSLKAGGTIVEATAGNTGLGIAFAALNKGYRVVFAVPEKFSSEKLTLMRALGAEIVHTPRNEGMLGAERRAKELLKAIPGSVMMGQFRNPRTRSPTTRRRVPRSGGTWMATSRISSPAPGPAAPTPASSGT